MTQYVLAPGVLIRPVADLRREVRERVPHQLGDHVVTTPNGRARALVVDQLAAEILRRCVEPRSVDELCASPVADGAASVSEVQHVLEHATSLGYLLDGDSALADASEAPLPPGTRIGEWRVVAHVVGMPDKHVYKARRDDGSLAALKLQGRGTNDALRHRIAREERILRGLVLPGVPALVGSDEHGGRPYLALEWCPGDDVLTMANRLRSAHRDPSRNLLRLRDVLVRVLRVYESLHGAGVAHGDIHPKNILVDRDTGEVSLVDFEFAVRVDDDAVPPRGGVPYFFEPAYGAAVLEGRQLPPATFASDVHGLAALSYLVLTGHHYLPFRLDHGAFYRQIASGDMQPFAQIVPWTWPELERVLAAALGTPSEGDAGASSLAAALEACPEPRATSSALPPLAAWPADLIGQHRRGGVDDVWPLPVPSATVHHGAAGVAVALLHVASAANDPAVLADAWTWSCRARSVRWPEGFLGGRDSISFEHAQPWSLHYGLAGVHVVDALVGLGRFHAHDVNRALRAFADVTAGITSAGGDLLSGAAGALLGCALLFEALPDDPLLERGVLRGVAADALDRLELYGHGDGSNLGVAHGDAGRAYAALRWSLVSLSAPPAWAATIAEELCGRALDRGSGSAWVAPADWDAPQRARFAGSWCNGLAGVSLVLCAAFDAFQDASFLDGAIAAATGAAAADSNGPSLCCGDAGLAYALASVSRRTGEQRFLTAAVERAARGARSTAAVSSSLYKGGLGARYAEADLRHPEAARFPLFESGRWPLGWSHRHAQPPNGG